MRSLHYWFQDLTDFCTKNFLIIPAWILYLRNWNTQNTEHVSNEKIRLINNLHQGNLSRKEYIWAEPWENVSYVICEQQRRRSACASAQSDQRLCCLLLRQYNISRFYSRNSKTLASFYGCADRFVSGLFGNCRRHILWCRGSYGFSINTFPLI